MDSVSVANQICWETGDYSDLAECELCDHQSECSGYDDHDEDD